MNDCADKRINTRLLYIYAYTTIDDSMRINYKFYSHRVVFDYCSVIKNAVQRKSYIHELTKKHFRATIPIISVSQRKQEIILEVSKVTFH